MHCLTGMSFCIADITGMKHVSSYLTIRFLVPGGNEDLWLL